MAVNPRILENLRPVDSIRAAELSAKRWEKTRRIVEERAANAGVDPPPRLPRSLISVEDARNRIRYVWTKGQRESVYLANAIPVEMRQYFYDVERKLTRQYAPGKQSENVQYRLLVTRTAMLMCQVALEEVKEKPDRYLILKYDKQIQDYIGQLQRYTEAEKREIYVQQEIVVTTLSKVVSIAEATITDPSLRAAFMRGLSSMVTDEPLQLTGPADALEAEFSPLDADVESVAP